MKNVPNALTIGRIVITPIMLVLLWSQTLTGQAVALGLFIIAAVSDYLDGKLARSYQVKSRLGQFLDPFADKVLVLGTFVVLIFLRPEVVPWWAVALIALRDVMVTLLRSWAEARGRSLRTLNIARYKTLCQLLFLIGILVLLVGEKMSGGIAAVCTAILAGPVPFVILMGVVAFTVLTGALYFFRLEYAPPIDPHA